MVKFVGTVAVLMLIVFGFIVGFFVLGIIFNDRTTVLTADLPQNSHLTREVFHQRVVERFPLGSSVKAMKEYLISEGFKMAPSKASFVDQRFVLFCPTTYVVRWKEDKTGRLSEVAGEIYPICF